MILDGSDERIAADAAEQRLADGQEQAQPVEEERTVGVALSGGGHRATIFALGALLYLVDSGRNADVRAISSVSGGSITNAFVASLDKPFHEQSPRDFEREVARFAKQIAGSPGWWRFAIASRLSIAAYVLLSVLLVLQSRCWPSAAFLDSPTRLLSWIPIAILLLILFFVGLAGPLCRGTLWGWWGTWLYIDVLIASVLIATSSLVVTRTFLPSLVLGIAIGVLASQRNKLAELAFAATINPLPKAHVLFHGSRRLRDLPKGIRHVFCATEVHTSRHAYFSHDLFYVPAVGVAEPKGLRLSTAVQTSANFPGGFPLRYLFRCPEFVANPILVGPDRGPVVAKIVALTDGGVYDNTASSWFLEAAERFDLAHDVELWDRNVLCKMPGDERERVLRQLAAMKDVPAQLIIVNSSEPRRWRPLAKLFLVPFLGEWLQFIAIADVFYSVRGKAQSMSLYRRFLSREYRQHGQATVVSIAETPIVLAFWLAKRQELHMQLGHMYPTDVEISEDLKAGAAWVMDVLKRFHSDLRNTKRGAKRGIRATAARGRKLDLRSWARRPVERKFFRVGVRGLADTLKELSVSTRSQYVGTTLRPLGCDLTAHLLWHGYYQTMMNAVVMLDEFPLMVPYPPVLSEFQLLAGGRGRSEQPWAYYRTDS